MPHQLAQCQCLLIIIVYAHSKYSQLYLQRAAKLLESIESFWNKNHHQMRFILSFTHSLIHLNIVCSVQELPIRDTLILVSLSMADVFQKLLNKLIHKNFSVFRRAKSAYIFILYCCASLFAHLFASLPSFSSLPSSICIYLLSFQQCQINNTKDIKVCHITNGWRF